MDNRSVVTNYGTIVINKADQDTPYKLYRKVFKTKIDKDLLNDLSFAVKKYHPNYNKKEIMDMYLNLSENGCTYATMANIIVEQIGDDDFFKQNFGYSLYNIDGTINYNKLMVDIFACISNMVELNVNMYERYKFNDIFEAASSLLGQSFDNKDEAINALIVDNNSIWSAEGIDEDNKLIFQKKGCINKSFIGSYRDITRELFNIDKPDITREELENLLRNANYGFKFQYNEISSKFSGAGSTKFLNLKKWLNKFFQVNGVDLDIEAEEINCIDINYEDFVNTIQYKLNNGYSIGVSSSLNSDVWMTDGEKLGWSKPNSKTAGHQMNFEGFDNEGNILVCSWGKTNIFPKEFYQNLDFMAVKISENDRDIKKSR